MSGKLRPWSQPVATRDRTLIFRMQGERSATRAIEAVICLKEYQNNNTAIIFFFKLTRQFKFLFIFVVGNLLEQTANMFDFIVWRRRNGHEYLFPLPIIF